MRSLPLLAVALLSLTSQRVHARGLENWPYERLFKQADLVVIAEGTAAGDSGEKMKVGGWETELLGVNTTFLIKHTLKGKHEGEQMKVFHLRLPPEVLFQNGPLLVSFRTKGLTIATKGGKGPDGAGTMSIPRPEYMLFLKKRKDGRYEAVSGQVDPLLSVKEMYRGELANSLERMHGK